MNRCVVLAVSSVAVGALVACSGDSGSPTSPSAFPADGSTTISGTAVAGGGASASGQRAGLSTTTPSFGALADNPSGVRVCVGGTDICVELGDSGTFELRGDFVGDVQLHFLGPGQDVRVIVRDVQNGETITVIVSLNGDSGTLDVQSRERGERVALCHLEGNGSYHRIEVSSSAEDAHIDHGDGYPGEMVPGTEEADGLIFDQDCDVELPEIEEEGVKVELCHLTANGSYRHIEVSADAVPAHEAHGDVRPGGVGASGGTLDEQCNLAEPD